MKYTEKSNPNFKHGHAVNGISPTYHSWAGMKARCTNPKHRSYARYGGNNITLCDEWYNFNNFLKDMGEKPKGTSIDRVDNTLGYFKENCRWATDRQQAINKRNTRYITFKGTTKTISEWSEITGIPVPSLSYRVHHGFIGDEIILGKL